MQDVQRLCAAHCWEACWGGLANCSHPSPVVAWFGDEGTALLQGLIARGECRLSGEGKNAG